MPPTTSIPLSLSLSLERYFPLYNFKALILLICSPNYDSIALKTFKGLFIDSLKVREFSAFLQSSYRSLVTTDKFKNLHSFSRLSRMPVNAITFLPISTLNTQTLSFFLAVPHL